MFSCWMYFYEIFNQNKDKQAFHINTFLITYQFLNNTQSCSTCSLIGKKGECAFTPWAVTSRLLGRRSSLGKPPNAFGFAFSRFSIRSTGQKHWWQFICVTNQLLDFCFFFSFKQLFETTTGILSIISWKFVVVCLKYNWLYYSVNFSNSS